MYAYVPGVCTHLCFLYCLWDTLSYARISGRGQMPDIVSSAVHFSGTKALLDVGTLRNNTGATLMLFVLTRNAS